MEPTPRRALAARFASIAAISLLAIAPGAAHAQSAAAEQRFTEAEALLAAGKIEEACDAFEESNRLEPGAGALINIGLCKEQLGELASALAAYRGALERVKDPKKKAIATERVAALEPRVSRLTITVAPEARVPDLAISRNGLSIDAADYDRPLLVDGGRHEIEARAPGYRRWSTSVRVAPEGDRASVTVPALAPLRRDSAGPSGEAEAGAGAAEPAPSSATGSSRRLLKIAGYSFLGLTVTTGAYVMYVSVAGPIPDYEELGQQPTDPATLMEIESGSARCADQALRDFDDPANRAFDKACSANQRRFIVGAVGIVSGLIGAATLYFAYRGDDPPAARQQAAAAGPDRRQLTVTPVIGPGGARASLRFAW
jgi:tetratricopeptide (TPR) repeat protein